MALSLEQFRARILHFRSTWRVLEPDASFLDLELESFIESTEESLVVREEIRQLESLLAGLRTRRDNADRRSAAVMERFVNLVRASPRHGDDSPFYRALGYIPASERKTGLTRKTKAPKTAKRAEPPQAVQDGPPDGARPSIGD